MINMLCSKNSTTEHVIVLLFFPVYYLDTGNNSFGTRKTNGSEITNSYSRSVRWVSNFDKTLYCYLQNSVVFAVSDPNALQFFQNYLVCIYQL